MERVQGRRDELATILQATKSVHLALNRFGQLA